MCSFSNRFTPNNRDQLSQQTLQPEPPKHLPGCTPCPGYHVTQLWLSHLPSSSVGKHRITECSGLGGTSMGHLVQPPCPSRVIHSRLHRTLSRRVLNISREGDSKTNLGSLFQGSVTLRGKKFFLMFRWNFLSFSLCPLPLSCRWAPLERAWPHPPDTHPSDICKHL